LRTPRSWSKGSTLATHDDHVPMELSEIAPREEIVTDCDSEGWDDPHGCPERPLHRATARGTPRRHVRRMGSIA
jgi:hypothetical protein